MPLGYPPIFPDWLYDIAGVAGSVWEFLTSPWGLLLVVLIAAVVYWLRSRNAGVSEVLGELRRRE
ncbi:MAG: hypothetical protein SV760_01135 [Halobacteria archaeon]|nr:hypothetical protein [Halobacteria archaeon]